MINGNQPQDMWKAYVAHLEEGRPDEWLELWAPDGDFVVQYGRDGVPEEYHGKGDIHQFIWGAADKLSMTRFTDVVVSEVTGSTADVFFTTFNLWIALKTGYLYQNEIAVRVMLEDGKIKHLWEFADPIRRNAFIRALRRDAASQTSSESAQVAHTHGMAASTSHAVDAARDLADKTDATTFAHVFVENEVKAFVHKVLGFYDKHVPVEEIAAHLVEDLEMHFPGTETIRSHGDFKKWYDGVKVNAAWNTHRVEHLDVKVVGDHTHQVDLSLVWVGTQTQGAGGKPFARRVHQRWRVIETGNPVTLKVKRYFVTAYCQLASPTLMA